MSRFGSRSFAHAISSVTSRRSPAIALAVLCVVGLPAAAHASSLGVTPPSASPNYWQAVSFEVNGVADQDAQVFTSLARGDVTCPALQSDVVLLGANRASRSGVPAGPFQFATGFPEPKADPFEQAGVGPGPITICAYLMPSSYDQRTQNPSPPALARATAHFTLGPDCLGFTALAPPRTSPVDGAFGEFRFSGQISWQVSMLVNRRQPATTVGPGAWSATGDIPSEARADLRKGLQVYRANYHVEFSQVCRAADGSSAPAPYDVVADSQLIQLRVGPGATVLDEDELPKPTFKGAMALESLVTPAVTFPPNARSGGRFDREVRVRPVGGGRPVLVAKGGLEVDDEFTVELTKSGKAVLARLAKRKRSAKLLMETTFSKRSPMIELEEPGPVKKSSMQIVRSR